MQIRERLYVRSLISLKIFSIFTLSGGFVPSSRQAAVPVATPYFTQSSTFHPFVYAVTKPAMVLSPAPIVETTSILGGMTLKNP